MSPAGPSGRGRRPSPLAVSAGFKALVLDNLRDVAEITDRAMFGGVGLYSGDLFFGIIAADVLYLKVDESTRKEYERRGMLPFAPFPDRPTSLNYFSVPTEIVESPLDLTRWANRAVKAAARAAAAESSAARRKRKSRPSG